ncbi:MAG: metal-dependent transcriptional regulator [Candidatus Methanogranum gryphiswaldense]|nr:MAG: metal-dependent transcriptional regulator [Candidatus Methanogranum sp. U3.2.1]
MSSGNREDYLISILRLTEGERAAKTTELANFMGISPASVTEMLKILSVDGYVEYEKYKGVKLTESGLNYARQIRKKHHVMENFLMNVLNVDHQTAHEEACKMEHAISEDSMLRLCQMVGTPVDSDCKSCGSPCKAACSGKIAIETLDQMISGDHGTISHLKSDNSDTVRRLISMGFVPGRAISVEGRISERGPRIVGIGDSTIALDVDLASAIYVDVED